MPALKLDIEIESGATFQREFTVTHIDGSAFDFSGYTVAANLNTSAGAFVAAFAITVTGNKILIEMPETTILPATTNFQHKYDVHASKAGAPDYRIAQGNVLISAAQTVI